MGPNMKKFSIIQRNKDKGSKIWYLRTFNTDTHRISYKSLNTSTKYKAEQLLDKEKQKIYLNPEDEKIESLPPLKKLALNWISYIESNYTTRTPLIYKGRIKDFLNFCEKNEIVFFKDFTSVHANDLVNDSEYKAVTKRNKKTVYKSFFNWILSTYDINIKNVFSKVKTQRVKKPIRGFWTPEQIKSILDNTSIKDIKLCFAFMAFCGLRVSEALNLKWGNLTDSTIEIINGKGGKNSVLPLSSQMKEQIKLYKEYEKISPDGNDKIFKLNFSKVWRELKRTCQKVKIDGLVYPHKFRHSFASNLLRNGGNIIAVSKLMRHSSPSITLNVYSHVLPNDLDQTLKLLDDKQ